MAGRSFPSLVLAAGILTTMVAASRADDTSKPAPDKSGYSNFNPVPDDALRTFAPDRPARAISPITVDAGRYQIESDFVSYTFANQQGATTRTYQAADPVLKLGITNIMDFEVAFAGFVDTRTRDNATGATQSSGRGFGDVTLTSKINLVGNDGGKIAFAVAPYLIVPSGTHIVSAGQLEGGVIAPLNLSLPNDFSLTLQTELDALANVNTPGTHVNYTNIINVSHPIPGIKNLTGTAEFYTSLTTETLTPDVYTFDLALAYLVDTNTQLDVGTNLGLSQGSPGYQIYGGIAHRF